MMAAMVVCVGKFRQPLSYNLTHGFFIRHIFAWVFACHAVALLHRTNQACQKHCAFGALSRVLRMGRASVCFLDDCINHLQLALCNCD